MTTMTIATINCSSADSSTVSRTSIINCRKRKRSTTATTLIATTFACFCYHLALTSLVVEGFYFRLPEAVHVDTGLSLVGNRRTQEVTLVSTENDGLPAPISQAPVAVVAPMMESMMQSASSGIAFVPPAPTYDPTSTSFPVTSTTTTRIQEQQLENSNSLDESSTSSDVLKHLAIQRNFASFVGTQGVAVVTGGTSGIGKETVTALAQTGMKVVVCARHTEKARQIVREIYAKGPGRITPGTIRVQSMNLTDLHSIEMAVEEISRIEGQIDVLCNNAGVSSVPTLQRTAQNFEMHFGTNYIGHYFLTRKLLPYMNKDEWRIVTVTSTAHANVKKLPMDASKLNLMKVTGQKSFLGPKYSPWKAYSRSKLATTLFALELQELLQESSNQGMKSIAVHPGTVARTDLWRQHDDVLIDSLKDHMSRKTPTQGAATSVLACLQRKDGLEGGDFMADCQIKDSEEWKSSSRLLLKDHQECKLQRKLWTVSEQMINDAGFVF